MSRYLDVVTITGEEYDNLLDSSEELRNAKAKIERMQDALQQAVNEATVAGSGWTHRPGRQPDAGA